MVLHFEAGDVAFHHAVAQTVQAPVDLFAQMRVAHALVGVAAQLAEEALDVHHARGLIILGFDLVQQGHQVGAGVVQAQAMSKERQVVAQATERGRLEIDGVEAGDIGMIVAQESGELGDGAVAPLEHFLLGGVAIHHGVQIADHIAQQDDKAVQAIVGFHGAILSSNLGGGQAALIPGGSQNTRRSFQAGPPPAGCGLASLIVRRLRSLKPVCFRRLALSAVSALASPRVLN